MMPATGGTVRRRTAVALARARRARRTTVVAQVYPTSDVVPENQLRLYIHFSAPMGLKGGLDYIHLLDDAGSEVKDPFLPLDTEFWNDDRTRYTVFFDPGRAEARHRADRGDGAIADARASRTRSWSMPSGATATGCR